jgi:hypothetical protein
MSVAAKLAAFAAVLVLCFAAAFGVGAAVGPIDDAPAEPGHGAPHAPSASTTPGDTAEPDTTAPDTTAPDTTAPPDGSPHGGAAPHGSEQGG